MSEKEKVEGKDESGFIESLCLTHCKQSFQSFGVHAQAVFLVWKQTLEA
jgi:hypothetical protein